MAAPSQIKTRDTRAYLGPRAVLRVFWRSAKAYRWTILWIVAATCFVEAVTNVVLPYIAKVLVDQLADGSVGRVSSELVIQTVLLFSGVAIIARLIDFVIQNAYVRCQSGIMADLEQASFRFLIGHSYRFFQDSFSGALVQRLNRLPRAFEQFQDAVQQRLISIVISVIGILIVVFRQQVLIGLVVTCWIAIMVGYNAWYVRRKMKEDVVLAEQESKNSGLLSDIISNLLTVKLFSAQKRESATYKNASDTLRTLRYRVWRLHGVNRSIQGAVLVIVQGVVLIVSVRLWSEGRLTAGDIVLLQSYFAILFRCFLEFSRMIRIFYKSFADGEEMVRILETPYDVLDEPNSKKIKSKLGRIEFKQVSFGYGEGEKVLNDFTLSIAPKEKVAFVGSSGAGKSTVTKLLLRFYDVTSGSILIDGQDLRKITQESLRESIAIVPQEPILFHRSLLENIRYGHPTATEKEVIKAAKLAHCHEFIQALPHKYETLVGERGVKLSGGERQRVAIARAILKNAPILVLDEATSSLDSESEGLIQDALSTLMKNKTTIVIAHRLSTIMSMDRIVIMDKGRVTDTGTHAELVQQAGIYQKLWNLQVGGFFQNT